MFIELIDLLFELTFIGGPVNIDLILSFNILNFVEILYFDQADMDGLIIGIYCFIVTTVPIVYVTDIVVDNSYCFIVSYLLEE